MKLNTKLVVSFCIILILPVALMIAVTVGYSQYRTTSIEGEYGISTGGTSTIFANSVEFLDQITQDVYAQIEALAEEDASQLENVELLEEKNEDLLKNSAFLIVRIDDSIYYNGAEDDDFTEEEWLSELPAYGSTENNADSFYYYGNMTQTLLKQVDFESEDGGEGSVFLVTSTESLLPEMQQYGVQLLIVILLIMAVTAGLMTLWLQRSILSPIRKLQSASKKIKDGKLDFHVEYDVDDEMGELCRDFEEMRQQLQASTEMRLKSEQENRVLISNIAHDLKTPITAVKGYAEGLIDGVADTPEKQEKYLRTIYNKANEMDRLINELTIYSKIDTDRIPYAFGKINVAEYFKDCVTEIGMDLESRGVGLSYVNYADESVQIIADPQQLMRVINNIVSNAVKYMDPDRKPQINMRVKDVGDFIQFEIEDNGKGISSKDLPYIFDRFYRTDASRNSKTGGSGIGLSIVRKIIEDHGGRIWATSKPGSGTTMYFVLRKYMQVPVEE